MFSAYKRFGGEEFADRRTQHRAAIAHARKRRLPGALEVQVPVLAGRVVDLAEQQARDHHPVAACSRRTDARNRPSLAARHRPTACGRRTVRQILEFRRWPDLDPAGPSAAGTGDDQTRIVDRLGQHVGGERIAQAGEAIVEGQFVEGFQGPAPAECPSILLGIDRLVEFGRRRLLQLWFLVVGAPARWFSSPASIGTILYSWP